MSSAAEIEAAAALAAGNSSLRPASDFVALFAQDVAQADRALLLGAFDGALLIGYSRVAHFVRPDNAPVHCAPTGWYLLGVVVNPQWTRQGVATRLTTGRLMWLETRSPDVFYVANPDNVASIELHRKLEFKEVRRDVSIPPALTGLTLFRLIFEVRAVRRQERLDASN